MIGITKQKLGYVRRGECNLMQTIYYLNTTFIILKKNYFDFHFELMQKVWFSIWLDHLRIFGQTNKPFKKYLSTKNFF